MTRQRSISGSSNSPAWELCTPYGGMGTAAGLLPVEALPHPQRQVQLADHLCRRVHPPQLGLRGVNAQLLAGGHVSKHVASCQPCNAAAAAAPPNHRNRLLPTACACACTTHAWHMARLVAGDGAEALELKVQLPCLAQSVVQHLRGRAGSEGAREAGAVSVPVCEGRRGYPFQSMRRVHRAAE